MQDWVKQNCNFFTTFGSSGQLVLKNNRLYFYCVCVLTMLLMSVIDARSWSVEHVHQTKYREAAQVIVGLFTKFCVTSA